MSTNYYMHTKDKEFVKKYFDGEYELTDEPYFSYCIHIGKRSGGWKPLFEAHEKAYCSVKEMLAFLHEHRCRIEVYNEYMEKKTINELEDELVNWGWHEKEKRYSVNKSGGIVEDDGGPLRHPFDHVEYFKYYRSLYMSNVKYWHDADGYDFTNGSFS